MTINLCPCQHSLFGYVLDGNVLRKNVEGSRHMLRKPRGWAIQEEVFNYHYAQHDVARVVIADTETGVAYSAEMETIARVAIEIERGYGLQYAVPLPYWKTEQGETLQMRLL